MLTTGYQLAAARALIGMDQVELAEKVGLSANTIRNMEASKGKPIAGRSQNVGAVQRALEAEGVEFLNHGQPGVRMRSAEMQTLSTTSKWWELHLDPERGWINGDHQGDYGELVKGEPRPATAVATLREFGLGGYDLVWRTDDLDALRRALAAYRKLPSGAVAPTLVL